MREQCTPGSCAKVARWLCMLTMLSRAPPKRETKGTLHVELLPSSQQLSIWKLFSATCLWMFPRFLLCETIMWDGHIKYTTEDLVTSALRYYSLINHSPSSLLKQSDNNSLREKRLQCTLSPARWNCLQYLLFLLPTTRIEA